ncbi:hypothetical protein [Singulisphaera sp. PoT]|uniref:hypothetical protein n=1 Tax=Singulisphaera sp. PoT TaxID=3411797 RepID=UPI003BF47EB2
MPTVPDSRGRQSKGSSATLSDLFVLVLGVALALSLRWDSTWRFTPHPSMPRTPVWKWDGQFVEEAIEKACLALIPLMLWRRVRLGGVCRPAELLLVACGTPLVVEDIDWALWHSESRMDIDTAGDLGALFWRCHVVAWIACLAATSTLILLRRRLGDRACSALLTFALATSFAWLLMPMENLANWVATRYELGSAGETAVSVAARTVAFLVPGVLGAAAVRDAFQRPESMTVLGWAGLLLAGCDLFVALPVNLWGRYMPAIPPLRDVQLHAMYFGGPLAASILGGLLAPFIGTRWDRWFGTTSPDPGTRGTPAAG